MGFCFGGQRELLFRACEGIMCAARLVRAPKPQAHTLQFAVDASYVQPASARVGSAASAPLCSRMITPAPVCLFGLQGPHPSGLISIVDYPGHAQRRSAYPSMGNRINSTSCISRRVELQLKLVQSLPDVAVTQFDDCLCRDRDATASMVRFRSNATSTLYSPSPAGWAGAP